MPQSDLAYLNAINILASAKIDALQGIDEAFDGEWERAWHANLKPYLPSDLDYERQKKKLDPEKAWKELERWNMQLITIHDKAYPRPLKHIHHPPFLLYVRGSIEILKNKSIAVVGTRALTDYGKRITPSIVRDLARAGFTIASGLAAGIDTLAHQAALDAGVPTIAVLGCGSDDPTIFPAQNIRLAQSIIKNGGAVITEYAPRTQARTFTFPQRNRIVSGLSQGTLVIEADRKSGALITAFDAIDQNRDVFAIPGPIFSKTSQGTNFLIQKGAKLVSTADDILEEYDMESAKQKPTIKADNEIEARILVALGTASMSPDGIIRATGLEASEANAALIVMELNKKVRNLGNGKYVVYS
ncbi:MAG: DNA protecting protein DprA [Candidatus Yanofskybacteria bacterium RIFCSPLOWO2_01_FULL_49_25]|uniref:DNA protecting protein DprA n=1 Tax=Candidatus Yanofskybacteria bacterium RIFCSPLOWO2_01_FULL_49_25 TaxID=1802701 RepID=A0A1F8GTC0_9BACT|nr:MAG: DNA protecting protein DprA [Candidatus Yanofskybacteria bacterium RIFCSPLOWO2_01_FULL_49_25]